MKFFQPNRIQTAWQPCITNSLFLQLTHLFLENYPVNFTESTVRVPFPFRWLKASFFQTSKLEAYVLEPEYNGYLFSSDEGRQVFSQGWGLGSQQQVVCKSIRVLFFLLPNCLLRYPWKLEGTRPNWVLFCLNFKQVEEIESEISWFIGFGR